MPIFYTDTGSFNKLEVTGSTILSGSLIVSGSTIFDRAGITGSLLGTSSIAQTASFIEYVNVANKPTLVSGSSFSSPSQGTVRAVINGLQTDVDTGLQTGDSPQFTNLNISSTFTASIVSASTSVTASRLQLNGLTDTTATNKVLVLNTTTNQIFTTASVGSGGAGSPAFPFNGNAVITGSLIISGSSLVTGSLLVTGSIAASSISSSGTVTASNLYLNDPEQLEGGTISFLNGSRITSFDSVGTSTITLQSNKISLKTEDGATTILESSLIDERLSTVYDIVPTTTGKSLGLSGNPWDTGYFTKVQATAVTSSFTGSFTGALTHFTPSTLKITVGTTAPSSPAINDLWIDTN